MALSREEISAYGIPQVVKFDNAPPPFNGSEFEQFAKYLCFKHRKVSPLWPKANGEVERFIKKPLERCYAPLLTGSKICISSYATIVPLPIALQVSPMLQPCLGGQLESSYPTMSLHQVVKVVTL